MSAKLADLSDWKVYCKSKVRRVCLWFAREEACVSVALSTFAAAPVEHLLQLIQSVDSGCSIVRDIARTHTNMFWQCLSTYASMVLAPLSSTLAPPWAHDCEQGSLFCAAASRVLWGAVLHLSAWICRDLAMVYDFFPYKLVGLVLDDDELAANVMDELQSKPACCLDRGMSLKVRFFVRHRGSCPSALLAAIRSWCCHSRISNMCTERLLSYDEKLQAQVRFDSIRVRQLPWRGPEVAQDGRWVSDPHGNSQALDRGFRSVEDCPTEARSQARAQVLAR